MAGTGAAIKRLGEIRYTAPASPPAFPQLPTLPPILPRCPLESISLPALLANGPGAVFWPGENPYGPRLTLPDPPSPRPSNHPAALTPRRAQVTISPPSPAIPRPTLHPAVHTHRPFPDPAPKPNLTRWRGCQQARRLRRRRSSLRRSRRRSCAPRAFSSISCAKRFCSTNGSLFRYAALFARRNNIGGV